jgi:hypothetical protein
VDVELRVDAGVNVLVGEGVWLGEVVSVKVEEGIAVFVFVETTLPAVFSYAPRSGFVPLD